MHDRLMRAALLAFALVAACGPAPAPSEGEGEGEPTPEIIGDCGDACVDGVVVVVWSVADEGVTCAECVEHARSVARGGFCGGSAPDPVDDVACLDQ